MIGRRSDDDAQSFHEAWSGRAPRDEHIAELVRFAEHLCESAVVEPSTRFRDSLRTQLMAEAETVLVTQPGSSRTPAAPVSRRRPLRRRVAALTAALVASAGVVGLVASSASAVPGEMLYPIKRTVETVELQLHRDDASRGKLQLAQASERLAEARELSAKGSSENLIAKTLDDFASQASSGSSSLFDDFTDSGEEQSIRTVNDFAAEATADLSTLSPELPAGAGASFDAATAAISELATQASSLCVSCSTGDVQQLVAAVTGLAGATRTTAADNASPDKKAGRAEPRKSPSPSSTSPSAAAPTTPLPVIVAPTVPPTTKAPGLSAVTDPLIGALLGDDNQKGLVPGLLGGLLGK